ncbi:hypothetical protein [Promicromonospora sp. NPDC057488]|uniref:hypothetical protein n=1 Tax=Promicromonospora sp. NPDC057488 TaxID=3346147 RepID=UPI00366D70A8
MRAIGNSDLLVRVTKWSASRAGRVTGIWVLSLAMCGFGGSFGYLSSWILTFYTPGRTERELLVVAAVVAALLIVMLIVLRRVGMSRFAASWFLVGAAATYLWMSTTFEPNLHTVTSPTFGVFAVQTPGNAEEVTRAHLTIDDTDAWLHLEAAPGSSPLVIIVTPVPPEYGCGEYADFETSTAYTCVAPTSVPIDHATSYSWSGAGREAGGVEIATSGPTQIGDLPVTALPVDVTFRTHSPSDAKTFDRALLGTGAVDQYDVTFLAEAQTPTDDHWTAMVEHRFPRGLALLSIARDLSLILLGGAISLFLIPPTPTPTPISQPLPVRSRTRQPRRLSTHSGRLRTNNRVGRLASPARRQRPSA